MNIPAFTTAFAIGFGTYNALQANKPQPPSPNSQRKNISFGYNNILKTLWKQGKLPTVTKGFYGDVLTKSNVSLEHLQPHSQGGPTSLSNLVLASKYQNNMRGCEPLADAIDKKSAIDYLKQFIGVTAHGKSEGRNQVFNGNDYIKKILKTLKRLGIDFGSEK